MAAMLVEIKSRMLLPRPPAGRDGGRSARRAGGRRGALKYERMKLAAAGLDEPPQAERGTTPSCGSWSPKRRAALHMPWRQAA